MWHLDEKANQLARQKDCVFVGMPPSQVLRRRRDRSVVVAPRGGWNRSPVFGRGFRLERRRNRMGRWEYTLEVAPAGRPGK
jgi:hypothetical protein